VIQELVADLDFRLLIFGLVSLVSGRDGAAGLLFCRVLPAVGEVVDGGSPGRIGQCGEAGECGGELAGPRPALIDA
jgi:hypothetical protein